MNKWNQPFQTCRRNVRILQQTTFANNVTNGEIAYSENVLLLKQCIQLYSINNSYIYRNCPFFSLDVFKVICWRFDDNSAADDFEHILLKNRRSL